MPTFLRGLFEEKAAPKNAVPRAVSNSRGGLYTGVVPNTQIWDMDQALNQAYERVIWVYRCIDAIASNSSAVPMILREYNDIDGQIVEDDQLLNLLNRRPNIYETAQQFRYRVASQALLSRRGVFIEVVRDRAGRPKELHILPNTTTTPIPDAQKFVSGYTVQTVTQGIVELKPEQVIWLRIKPHPTDVYAQMTPLVSAGLAADTDFLARLYNRNFLANDGRPGMLIAVQGQLMPEDAEEIRRRFSGGPTVAGQTTVIEADGLSATDMSSSPRDVMWQDAVRGSREDIMLAFGVPESVLGNASGRTFDNADAEFEIFWTVTMQPFMDAIAAGYDILTPGGLEDDYFVAHDYSKVDVLQRQERRRHDKALAEFESGVLTIDQYLQIVGREQFNVPGTNVLWIPQGRVPIGMNEEDTEAAAALMPVGMAAPPTNEDQARTAALNAPTSQNNLRDMQAARALRLAGKQGGPFELESKHLPGQHNQETHGRDKGIPDIDLSWKIPSGRVCAVKSSREQIDAEYQDLIDRPYVYKPKDGSPELVVDLSDEQLDDHFRSTINSGSESDIEEGMRWYDEARAEAQAMADEYGVTLEVAAGVIAALSPQKRWKGNLTVARKALAAYKSGEFDDMTDDEMAAAIKVGFAKDAVQAVRIMRTGNVTENLTGLKRRSFVNNIVNPDAGYDVTVDGWVAAALKKMQGAPEAAALKWLGRSVTRNKEVVIEATGYLRIADSLRRIAKERGITPAQAQAIYWVVVGGGRSKKGTGMWA